MLCPELAGVESSCMAGTATAYIACGARCAFLSGCGMNRIKGHSLRRPSPSPRNAQPVAVQHHRSLHIPASAQLRADHPAEANNSTVRTTAPYTNRTQATHRGGQVGDVQLGWCDEHLHGCILGCAVHHMQPAILALRGKDHIVRARSQLHPLVVDVTAGSPVRGDDSRARWCVIKQTWLNDLAHWRIHQSMQHDKCAYISYMQASTLIRAVRSCKRPRPQQSTAQLPQPNVATQHTVSHPVPHSPSLYPSHSVSLRVSLCTSERCSPWHAL